MVLVPSYSVVKGHGQQTMGLNHCVLFPLQTAATRIGEESYETSVEPLVLTLPASFAEHLPPITVQCHGHYGEPTFEMECPPLGKEQCYRMSYEVLARGDWVVTKEKSREEILAELERMDEEESKTETKEENKAEDKEGGEEENSEDKKEESKAENKEGGEEDKAENKEGENTETKEE